MQDARNDFDVVVLGAGTAGAAVAWMLARAGRRVALTDVRSFHAAGARWVNGVPPWMFDRAGIPRPEAPERRPGDGPFSLLGPSGRKHVTLSPSPVWSVDMRLLVRRLQRMAREAGVVPVERARLADVEVAGGRPRAIVLGVEGRGGSVRRRLTASLFIDASGLAAALRRRVPLLARDCPPPPRMHVCTAAQAICRVRDAEGARRFLDRYDARPGEVLGQVGVAGGYSTGNVAVASDFDEVDLLSGAIAGGASGMAILDAIRGREPWIGERVFGGASAIPIRRPYDRLSGPGVALIGNAACQVFGAHGSGIGVGLVAARLLADAVGAADDPGDAAATWAYQHAFHVELGGLLAGYDLGRRFSQNLSPDDVEALLSAGLLDARQYAAALDQRLPAVDLAGILQKPRAALRCPRLAARLGPVVARMPLILRLYRRHPERPDERALAWWSRGVARQFNELPDVAA